MDTRTPVEYDAWHIPEAILSPYTELRDRLDEVPRDKPVYTYCRSGFRSYIAYGVLAEQKPGWDDVAFLSGGMMTYHGFHRTPLEVGKGGMPVVATLDRTNWPSAPVRSSMSDAPIEVAVGALAGLLHLPRRNDDAARDARSAGVAALALGHRELSDSVLTFERGRGW